MEQIAILKDENISDLIKEECTNKGYSNKTIISYTSWANRFLRFTNGILNETKFKPFATYLSNDLKVKPTTRNNAIWALVFVFNKCLEKNLDKSLIPETSKIPSTMPNALSKDEIMRMVNSVECSTKAFTLKQRLYIELPYSAGLRLAETINLKVDDIDFEHNVIYVRQGKGLKDRTVQLAEQVKKDIIGYLKRRKNLSNPYLLDKGETYHISGKTVWKVLRRQARICNITKRVHPHILRDSYATHLLWSGVDSRFIQPFLGHSRLETTTKYTKVADPRLFSIKSPMDN